MRKGLVLLALGTLILVGPAASASSVSFDDVVKMLEAKIGESIILRQVASSGVGFGVGVNEILALRKAGASDHLIESLMEWTTEAPAPAGKVEPAGGQEKLPFRIFKETTPDGEEVLHVTNLDASGRRMGGELPPRESAPRNRYEEQEPEGRESTYTVVGERGEPSPPVVVNIYPPAPPETPAYEPAYLSPYMYRDPYDYLYPRGRLPGYYPGFYGGLCGVNRPGSCSHFMMQHTHYGSGWTGGCRASGCPHPGVTVAPAPRSGVEYRPIGPATAQTILQTIRSQIGRK